jgi:arginine decarboxylase
MMTTAGARETRAVDAAHVTARSAEGGSMFWKQVTKASVTAGTAEGGTPLNAFDNALLAAGIGNVNLIKVSSIVPPEVDIVDLPQIKPGALVPTAYAAMTSTTPGQIIAAAVGYALPVDRTKPGVIMEFHDVTDRGTAEEAIRGMLAEAFRVRGEPVREVKVVAVDHRVERAGCALAAVALLSEDDLV